MKTLLAILAAMLAVFGGGCVVLLSPWIATYFRTGGGPSMLNMPNVWGSMLALLAFPMLISSTSTAWAHFASSANRFGSNRRILVVIDLAACAAMATYVVYHISSYGMRSPSLVVLIPLFALLIAKAWVQNRVLRVAI